MKKIFFIFLIILFITGNLIASSYQWTKRIGGIGTDYGKDIAVDSSGNIYVTGVFTNTVNFAQSWSGIDNKTTAGEHDIFITKINSDGSYGWTKKIGGIGRDNVNGVAVDISGNVYVTGDFEGTVDFAQDWSGTDNKTNAGECDIFITKVNSDGSYGWTKRIGTTGRDVGWDIVVDGNGNAYVTGGFGGANVNFAQDWGITDNKTNAGGAGVWDIFITKINLDGSYGWTKIIGALSTDVGRGVGVDNSGNIYVTGHFGGTVNFAQDWSGTDNKASAGGQDIFITKVNSGGGYEWTKTIGGLSNDWSVSAVIDSSGNAYVTGKYMNTVNFAQDWSGTDNKTAAGDKDVFIAKVNSDGSYGWTKKIGAIGIDDFFHISVDINSNGYVIGEFENTVNFAQDWSGTDNKTAAGGKDVFITKVNSDGSYGWTKTMGGTEDDYGFGVAVDNSINVYVTGFFGSTVNFAQDWSGTDNKTSAGSVDTFITKIKTLIPPTISLLEPDGKDDTAVSNYIIKWIDSDPDDNAGISLYYDTDKSGYDGTLIVSGLSEDNSVNQYIWDCSEITRGTYYIYAIIDDGINPLVYGYSLGAITLVIQAPKYNEPKVEVEDDFKKPGEDKEFDIGVNLNKAGKVTIEVYDIQGELVHTICWDEQFDKGYHNIRWEVKNALGSGVYWVVMKGEDWTKTKRVAIVK